MVSPSRGQSWTVLCTYCLRTLSPQSEEKLHDPRHCGSQMELSRVLRSQLVHFLVRTSFWILPIATPDSNTGKTGKFVALAECRFLRHRRALPRDLYLEKWTTDNFCGRHPKGLAQDCVGRLVMAWANAGMSC